MPRGSPAKSERRSCLKPSRGDSGQGRQQIEKRQGEEEEQAEQQQQQRGPEFVLGSLLEVDLSSATHIYVSSLCMPDSILDALWQRLTSGPEQPRNLQVVASLRAFREPAAGERTTGSGVVLEVPVSEVVDVEMSWSRAGGDGTPVFVYRMEAYF